MSLVIKRQDDDSPYEKRIILTDDKTTNGTYILVESNPGQVVIGDVAYWLEPPKDSTLYPSELYNWPKLRISPYSIEMLNRNYGDPKDTVNRPYSDRKESRISINPGAIVINKGGDINTIPSTIYNGLEFGYSDGEQFTWNLTNPHGLFLQYFPNSYTYDSLTDPPRMEEGYMWFSCPYETDGRLIIHARRNSNGGNSKTGPTIGLATSHSTITMSFSTLEIYKDWGEDTYRTAALTPDDFVNIKLMVQKGGADGTIGGIPMQYKNDAYDVNSYESKKLYEPEYSGDTIKLHSIIGFSTWGIWQDGNSTTGTPLMQYVTGAVYEDDYIALSPGHISFSNRIPGLKIGQPVLALSGKPTRPLLAFYVDITANSGFNVAGGWGSIDCINVAHQAVPHKVERNTIAITSDDVSLTAGTSINIKVNGKSLELTGERLEKLIGLLEG